jgi:hypothetical protein
LVTKHNHLPADLIVAGSSTHENIMSLTEVLQDKIYIIKQLNFSVPSLINKTFAAFLNGIGI